MVKSSLFPVQKKIGQKSYTKTERNKFSNSLVSNAESLEALKYGKNKQTHHDLT